MAIVPENLSEEAWEDLVQGLRNIQGCDLSVWDTNFIEDMLERLERYGTSARITGPQWQQIQRLKEQYE